MFPVDYFRWHAAKAIISAERGDNEQAVSHADQAFGAAQVKKSGFRFHQKLGLVDKEYKDLVNELRGGYTYNKALKQGRRWAR